MTETSFKVSANFEYDFSSSALTTTAHIQGLYLAFVAYEVSMNPELVLNSSLSTMFL